LFYYLPCALYAETLLSFGPEDFLAFPPLRFPKLILVDDADDLIDFAIGLC